MISAPSGCGKTTVVRELCARDKRLIPSISTTTRTKRPDESDQIDYFFVSKSEFDELIQQGAFLEHATVFGHQYGTQRAYVDQAIRAGNDMIFNIDWQGAQSIKENSNRAHTFFLLPPSIGELLQRLSSRGQDSEVVVNYRMEQARGEISHARAFDYVIVNDDLRETCDLIYECMVSIRNNRPVVVPYVEAIVEELLDG